MLFAQPVNHIAIDLQAAGQGLGLRIGGCAAHGLGPGSCCALALLTNADLKANTTLLCNIIMYHYYVPLLCTIIMYHYYVPLLCTIIM